MITKTFMNKNLYKYGLKSCLSTQGESEKVTSPLRCAENGQFSTPGDEVTVDQRQGLGDGLRDLLHGVLFDLVEKVSHSRRVVAPRPLLLLERTRLQRLRNVRRHLLDRRLERRTQHLRVVNTITKKETATPPSNKSLPQR